ncbi:hypothetical protein GA0115254_11474 [Streptomyces sp. Ncost-T10-10d]|nr:hypothetical protein GA0115254_11474 [Streptomyces sp. Ncost-T10-10d]
MEQAAITRTVGVAAGVKGTYLSVHTRARLDAVAADLNGRPRKTLDRESPTERLHTLLAA